MQQLKWLLTSKPSLATAILMVSLNATFPTYNQRIFNAMVHSFVYGYCAFHTERNYFAVVFTHDNALSKEVFQVSFKGRIKGAIGIFKK